jgi:hypothetical protein
MAKLPRYMKMRPVGLTTDERGHPAAEFEVRIAWWGWPVLLWEEIRKYQVRWWQWPYVTFILAKITISKMLGAP